MVKDPSVGGGERSATPRNVHWECLNYALRRVKSKNRGDTYVISMRRASNEWDAATFTFVIQYTSSTEYIYWFSRG